MLQNFNTRGFESSIEPSLLFGLGKVSVIDSLQVTWPDGKVQFITQVKSDQTITLKNSEAILIPTHLNTNAKPAFEEVGSQIIVGPAVHHEDRYNDFNDEILLIRLLSTEGPRLIIGDVNNDKLSDFILLGASGDPDKLFIQNTDGRIAFQQSAGTFNKDAAFESTCGAFFDYDGDGDLDLIIGSGGNEAKNAENKFHGSPVSQ